MPLYARFFASPTRIKHVNIPTCYEKRLLNRHIINPALAYIISSDRLQYFEINVVIISFYLYIQLLYMNNSAIFQ